MKKLLTLIIASLALLVFVPSEARADHGRRFVGYDHCGNAVYSVRCVVGYDCHGCPIYRWRTETVALRHHGGFRVHAPHVSLSLGHHRHHGHGHGHGHGH
jgi:hypothetical protein